MLKLEGEVGGREGNELLNGQLDENKKNPEDCASANCFLSVLLPHSGDVLCL